MCGDKCGGCQVPNQNSDQSVELAECKERLLRVTADLQNFRRRVEKERAEWWASGQIEIVRSLLPVVDDLALAVTAGADQGTRLIYEKALATLKALGVEEMVCDGMFDPEMHEALATVEGDGKVAGSVVEVLQRGYVMKGRVVRHARVSVAK